MFSAACIDNKYEIFLPCGYERQLCRSIIFQWSRVFNTCQGNMNLVSRVLMNGILMKYGHTSCIHKQNMRKLHVITAWKTKQELPQAATAFDFKETGVKKDKAKGYSLAPVLGPPWSLHSGILWQFLHQPLKMWLLNWFLLHVNMRMIWHGYNCSFSVKRDAYPEWARIPAQCTFTSGCFWQAQTVCEGSLTLIKWLKNNEMVVGNILQVWLQIIESANYFQAFILQKNFFRLWHVSCLLAPLCQEAKALQNFPLFSTVLPAHLFFIKTVSCTGKESMGESGCKVRLLFCLMLFVFFGSFNFILLDLPKHNIV